MRTGRPRIDLPVYDMAVLYEDNGLTGVEIAAEYGVSRQTVLRRLSEIGVEIHSEYTGSLRTIVCKCGESLVSRGPTRKQCDGCRREQVNGC